MNLTEFIAVSVAWLVVAIICFSVVFGSMSALTTELKNSHGIEVEHLESGGLFTSAENMLTILGGISIAIGGYAGMKAVQLWKDGGGESKYL